MSSVGMDLLSNLGGGIQKNDKTSAVKEKAGFEISNAKGDDFQTQIEELLSAEQKSEQAETGQIGEEQLEDVLFELFGELSEMLSELEDLISDNEFLDQLMQTGVFDESIMDEIQELIDKKSDQLKTIFTDQLEQSDSLKSETDSNWNLGNVLTDINENDSELDVDKLVEELDLQDLIQFAQMRDLSQLLEETQDMFSDLDDQALAELGVLLKIDGSAVQEDMDQSKLEQLLKKAGWEDLNLEDLEQLSKTDIADKLSNELLAKNDLSNSDIADKLSNELLAKNNLSKSANDITSKFSNLTELQQLTKILTEQGQETEQLFSELSEEDELLLKEMLAQSLRNEQGFITTQTGDSENLKNHISALVSQNKNSNTSKDGQTRLQQLLAAMTERESRSGNEDYLISKIQSAIDTDGNSESIFKPASPDSGFLLTDNDNVTTNQQQNFQFMTQQFNQSELGSEPTFDRLASQRNQEIVSNIREMIMQQVNVKQEEDNFTMKMRVKPEQLGQLKMQFSFQDGELRGHIFTQDAQARDLIQANLVDLRQQLGEQGLEFSELDVSVDQGDSDEAEQFDMHQFGTGNYKQKLQDHEENEETENLVGEELVNNYETGDYHLMSSGSMDLRV